MVFHGLDDTGHFVPMEKPELVADIIVDFLKKPTCGSAMTASGLPFKKRITATIALGLTLFAILWTWVGPARAQTELSDPAPVFKGYSGNLPPEVMEEVRKYSWRPGCPVPLEDLSYLEVGYIGFDGRPHTGRLIVHRTVASEVVDIFRELFEARFPIERMELIDYYQGSDNASMAANNTSAFNCRPVTGGGGFSKHSYGRALDINPLLNPYMKDDLVLPPAGTAYADRSQAVPGLIVDGDTCCQAFTARGWEWGGNWQSLKDYQHFQKKSD